MTMVVQNLTGVLTGPWRDQLQERHTAACGKPGSRPGEHLPCSVTSWPSPSLLGPLAEPHRTPEAEDPARPPPRAQSWVEKVGLEGPMANALCITGWLGRCWKVTFWRQSQFIEGEVFCTDLFGAVLFCLELGAMSGCCVGFPPLFLGDDVGLCCNATDYRVREQVGQTRGLAPVRCGCSNHGLSCQNFTGINGELDRLPFQLTPFTA